MDIASVGAEGKPQSHQEPLRNAEYQKESQPNSSVDIVEKGNAMPTKVAT